MKRGQRVREMREREEETVLLVSHKCFSKHDISLISFTVL